MAQDIVGSLFGITPESYQQLRQQQQMNEAVKMGSLTPEQFINTQAYRGGQAAGNVIGGLLGVEDPELKKIRDVQAMRGQFDVSTSQGLRDFASALSAKGYADLASQAAAEADRRALVQAQTVRALREPGVNAFEKLLSSGKYTPASIAKYQQSQNPADLVLVKGAAGEGGVGGLGKPTVAQKAVDNKFAKEYNDFYAGGGVANLRKNLEELDRAINIIEKSEEGETSGRLVGLADKAGTLSFTNRKASDVKDIIGGVAQSNLRQILGGQFAQKEGEALLARQYDTAQSKKNNLARLKALRNQAETTLNAKEAAAQYYEENGTLQGFKGTQITAPKEQSNQKKKVKFSDL